MVLRAVSLSLAGWDDMQVVVMPHDVDWGLLVSALPLCLLSRAANIFPLAALANRLRTIPIPFNMQVMQWLCGLRGAIAYALVINLPQQKGGTQVLPPSPFAPCTLHRPSRAHPAATPCSCGPAVTRRSAAAASAVRLCFVSAPHVS
jgi:NhaP-type Na+/H+ or K+/H+ antiporter